MSKTQKSKDKLQSSNFQFKSCIHFWKRATGKIRRTTHSLLIKSKIVKVVGLFEVVSFTDIIVVPYEDILDTPNGRTEHKGGPIWNNWNSFNQLRHKREVFIDVVPPTPQSQDLTEETRPLFWCGAIVGHFGHQVADFTSRIPAYKMYEAQNNLTAYYCFAVGVERTWQSVADAPSYFKAILDWYDIDQTQVVIINRPTRVKHLLATPQLEPLRALGTKLESRYLRFLNEHVNAKLGSSEGSFGTYYISRAGIKGGELAGEAYLETFFEASGVKVVRPENISLHEQIVLYRSAENLIFLEGSALHVLQFLGNCNTNILIINRRSGTKLMQKSLESRFQNIKYFDMTALIYGLSPAGFKARYGGISILDESLFLKFLENINLDSKHWESTVFKQAAKRHVKLWLDRKKASNDAASSDSMKLIYEKFDQLNMDVRDFE